jgi:hypothetical protein
VLKTVATQLAVDERPSIVVLLRAARVGASGKFVAERTMEGYDAWERSDSKIPDKKGEQ